MILDGDRLVRLTDEEWARLEPHLPKHGRTRTVAGGERDSVEAILYVLLSGCPWCDLPSAYRVSVSTTSRRFTRWQEEGVWQAMWRSLRAGMPLEERAFWACLFFDATLRPNVSAERYQRPKRMDRRVPLHLQG